MSNLFTLYVQSNGQTSGFFRHCAMHQSYGQKSRFSSLVTVVAAIDSAGYAGRCRYVAAELLCGR